MYVDDIMISADQELAYAVAAAIRECWECSAPQEVGIDRANPVRFLGMDLCWDSSRNLLLSQESYIKELENRYREELTGLGKPVIPLSGSFQEDAIEENPTHEQVRKTQALVGELLWASIRTRPDIAYSVSKLASTISKAPGATYKVGLQTLAYLTATSHFVLTYWCQNREVWENFKRNQDLTGCVEGYGDASFAPEARRSMQCLQIYVEGSLVAWSVSRQAFMAQSSCEAEMVALMDLANYTLSAAYLAEELLQRKAEKQLAVDNLAALAIYGGTAMHWRTRHLRIKAKAFQEKYSEGALPAHHVAGEWNAADIGTKSLPGARHWKLCDLLGLQASHVSRSAIKKMQPGTSNGTDQCLKAVILACCLCTTRGQPQPQSEDTGSDWILGLVMFVVIVAAIGLWEACRCVCRNLLVRGPQRNSRRMAQARAAERDDPQPDDEDELVEAPLPPPVEPPPETEVVEGLQIPRPQRPVDETGQAQYEEGLRRRGARVYRVEPDQEPINEDPEGIQSPRPPVPQPPVMARYLDDVAIAAPAARAEHVQRREEEEEEQGSAFGGPPPMQGGQGRRGQRQFVWEGAEVRREIARREAEQRLLDLPPYPPLVVNPNWGPAPHQPPLRYLRNECTNWGGEVSALHHLPPIHFRRDHYQIDHERSVLIRWHCANRVRLFTPETTRLPEPLTLEALSGRRRTLVHEVAARYVIDDNFRGATAQRTLQNEWRGRTELEVHPHVLEQQLRLQRQGP